MEEPVDSITNGLSNALVEETVDSVANGISNALTEDPSDEDDIIPTNNKRNKKVAVLSDSDSNDEEPAPIAQQDSDSDSNPGITTAKRRILKHIDSDNSNSDAEETLPQKSSRIHNKKTELANKFKNISKKCTQTDELKEPTVNFRESKVSDLYDSESSDDNNVNEDTFEKDEYSKSVPKVVENNIKKAKSAPQRMSAKQAMEQMHKIKSESCRMLREKRLHLPYHRPKQVTLKDVINKKKIEFLPGTKKLTLRMSEDQLKEYAKQLEEKEKDMLELCKSESESDEEDVEEKEQNSANIEDNQTNINLLENTETLENSSITPLNLETEDHEQTVDEKLPLININTENSDFFDSGIEKTQVDTINKIIDSLDCEEENVDDEQTEEEKINENLSVFQSEDSSKHYSESQPIESKKMSFIPETISCSLPVQPKLSGAPGSFIDFTPESNSEELSSVNVFKQKFIYQASLKTAEDIEREQEKKLPPGTALMNFKRELENKISKQRFEEWTKKKNEEQVKQSNEIGDELSECEELLKDEIEPEDKLINLNEDQFNEEDEEEDVEMIYPKRKPKNSYIEDEAESEDDCSNIEEEDSEEDSDNEQLLKCNENSKRTLTRICKPFQDSDTSNDEDIDSKKVDESKNSSSQSNENKLERMDSKDLFESQVESNLNLNCKKTSNKEVNDIFESQDDKKYDNESLLDESDEHLTLGQKYVSDITASMNNKSLEEINNTPVHTVGRPDLASLISPMIKLTGIQNSSYTDNISELASPLNSSLKRSSPDKWIHLQKQLFIDSETPDLTQGTQDIADLCSGKFPTQDNFTKGIQPSSMLKINSTESQMSQNTENELLGLCTGKFVGINSSQDTFPTDIQPLPILKSNSKESIETQMTQNTENELLELCTGKFVGINSSQDTLSKDIQTSPMPKMSSTESVETQMTQNTEKELLELCSGKFVGIDTVDNDIVDSIPETESLTSIKVIADVHQNEVNNQITTETNDKPKVLPCKTSSKDKTIKSFFTSMAKNINKPKSDLNEKSLEEIVPLEDYPTQKLIISSSSSSNEELDNEMQEKKNKVLKSKKDHNKRRAKQLQISDDESSEDEDEHDSNNSLLEDCEVKYNSEPEDDLIEDHEIEYDSEENEIEVQKEIVELKKPKSKKSSEFFDHEAELTSDDEWKGSGDEDEKGLDEFEWEEGDADQIDEKKMNKELERIHRHQMLDQDNREIKILQEMLLEDGDLEGGTRERKFRWKNVDNSIESGAVVGDDNLEETLEEAQTEEEWRKQRHERETFLRQMMEKENVSSPETIIESSLKTSIRTSLIKSSLTSNTIKDIKTSASLVESNVHIETNVKKPKELPSPVKKPFIMMQNKFKGFLSRGEASLNRLALLAKTGQSTKDNETSTNLKPTNHRNFVFTAVSPPCNDIITEDIKRMKRKTATELSTPLLIKKIKLNESESSKFRKSLFDHID